MFRSLPAKASFATRAVHAGERAPYPAATPVASPITPSVSYLYEEAADLDAVLGGERSGPVYARFGVPTGNALESAVASLEGASAALATGSGMAAIHLALLDAGAHAGAAVVATQDCYGHTHTLLSHHLTNQGVRVRFVDMNDLDALEQALAQERPAAVILETISNPLLKVADLPAIVERAQAAEAHVIVDATFTTPWLCRPLEYGAAYVVHSATKYLGGHGDVMGGVIATNRPRRQSLHETLKLVGSVLGPQEAWLILRGLKTLPLRVQRQCENALAVARWLETHPAVARVNYPGLSSHPHHALATRLFGGHGYGGVVSFELAGGGAPAVFRFLEALCVVLPATSLGDVYSLALYPAMSSHRSLPAEERIRLGISDNLVRLSLGIEELADILADLDQALHAVQGR
jgi:cystathionine gamma-synthase/methionine-gamma-lyase